MAVQYVPIDGEQVSREWGIVLAAMREDHVYARVNEGHRTMARQTYFWRLYLSGRGNLAARPSSTAPHIRTGRIDHAIDFGNAAAALRWLRSRNIEATLPVRGESWHVEAPAGDLIAFARRHPADPLITPYYVKPFRKPSAKAVRELQKLLRDRGFASVKVNGRYDRRTRSAVGRFQHRHGLKVDRIIGPGTWRALRRSR